MESGEHLGLRHAAARWLASLGCTVAHEVRGPFGHYRFDVAAWAERPTDLLARGLGIDDAAQLAAAGHRGGTLFPDGWPITIIVECKATRADLASNMGDADAHRRRAASLRAAHTHAAQTWQRWGREPAGIDQPAAELNPGGDDALFDPQCPRVMRSASQAAATRADSAVYRAGKFLLLARYRVAHVLVLATTPDVRAPHTPAGWGWVEFATQRCTVPRSSHPAAPDSIDPAHPPRWRSRPLAIRAADRFADRLIRGVNRAAVRA